jgi:hypothetical protein
VEYCPVQLEELQAIFCGFYRFLMAVVSEGFLWFCLQELFVCGVVVVFVAIGCVVVVLHAGVAAES